MHRLHYGLRQTVAPSVEPVTLDEMKLFLRQDDSADDALITGLISAARRSVELHTGAQLVNATFRMTLDSFFGYQMPGGNVLLHGVRIPETLGGTGLWPYYGAIELPRFPVTAVSSITYTDPGGATQTYSTFDLDTDSLPARITPSYGTVWPVSREVPNAVKVTFVAGYGTDGTAVPSTYTLAIKLLVAGWYENRESVQSIAGTRLPVQLQALLATEDGGFYR
jgi:hypothetical protein